jgi:hypothetical protein
MGNTFSGAVGFTCRCAKTEAAQGLGAMPLLFRPPCGILPLSDDDIGNCGAFTAESPVKTPLSATSFSFCCAEPIFAEGIASFVLKH